MIALLPELSLLVLGLLVLGVESFGSLENRSRSSGRIQAVAGFGLVLVLIILCFVPGDSSPAILGHFQLSAFGRIWKMVFVAAALLTVPLSGSYLAPTGNLRGTIGKAGPYFFLLIFSSLGACLLVSAGDWLTFFLALELATLPLYALVGFQSGDVKSAEASVKYMVLGGLATSLVLFGISFLYLAAGKLDLQSTALAAQSDPSNPALWLGALFLLAGIGFKLAIAPFHMWAPDVYEGAPMPIMAFLSVGSKSAAAAGLALVFLGPLDPLRPALAPLLGGAAVLSMVVGNLGALRQRNLRRFAAYSSIAQAGYLLLAFLGNADASRVSLVYNLVAYGATSYCFYFVIGLIGKTGDETFASLRGLSRRNPAVALALLLAMFSLAGVPPLAGFIGKFLLFSTAAGSGRYGIVLLALGNAVLSFYYYMLVVKEAFIVPESSPAPAMAVTKIQAFSLSALTAALLFLGIFPNLGHYLQSLR